VPTTDYELIQLPANGLLFEGRLYGPEDGRFVLLLHGFPQTARSFHEVAAGLAAHGRRCLAFNQRGYSVGARPSAAEAYRIEHLVADVVGVLDVTGHQEADVVGHDWGAVVAWHTAIRHPDRIRTLTVLSAPHPVAFAAALASDPDQRARSSYLRTLRGEAAAGLLLAEDGRELRALLAGAPPPVMAGLEEFQDPAMLTGALNWYRAMSRSDSDGLGRVRVPTTYVWGTEDVAFGRTAAESCAAYADAPYRFVELAGAGHWLPDERPDVLVQEILKRTAP
jgi:pimeloyl-ACP methyl ester carboxylesterase